MFPKVLCRFVAATIIALAVSVPANAAFVIDQEAIIASPPGLGRITVAVGDRTPPLGSAAPTLVNAKVGQSVTAGVAGTLNGIDTQGPFWNTAFGSGHAFRLSLFDGDLGGSHTLVDTFDVPAFGFFPPTTAINSGTTFFYSVSNAGYAVRPGNVFSFSVELLGPPGSFGLINVGNISGTRASPIFQYNDYAGGTAYFSNNDSPYAAIARDVGFRTYVDEALAPAIPEPATWAMMILGFAALGIVMRHRGAVTAYASSTSMHPGARKP